MGRKRLVFLRASLALSLALAVAAVWGGAGCDARIEEPIGAARDRTSTPPTEPTVFARCMKPTPEVAEREVIGPVPAPGCPESPDPAPILARKGVTIHSDQGAKKVAVEVADQDAQRMRGLMYRTSMPENDGMLFVFQQDKELTFWMHNTCIPLDMMFIAADGVIVGIEENTPTLTDETFSAGCFARYVLEVNAGWTRKNGVKAGMKVDLPRP